MSGKFSKDYTVTSTGTNSQGNHYCHREYSSGEGSGQGSGQGSGEGSSQGSGQGYHYSNKDGSYYYSNPNGSTYYKNGESSTYTTPSGYVVKK
ncbi:hypothetical protein GGX14DRAFT_580635 [Mycena pura]|uniref:Uncharacterized protein n=1 Tax=Mycena pura TaxID=153505 RepID=A0AAD6Y104_9AGAR|nr:hypothetical protein GGX14DRAFT_580635 [Mycena pura]